VARGHHQHAILQETEASKLHAEQCGKLVTASAEKEAKNKSAA